MPPLVLMKGSNIQDHTFSLKVGFGVGVEQFRLIKPRISIEIN